MGVEAPDIKPVWVLTFAGSDSCAGARLQADLKTISALGGYAMTVVTPKERLAAATRLVEMGCRNVLIKGGHLEGAHCEDLLILGEGCSLPNVVSKAKAYLTKALVGGKSHGLGSGCGPMKHFHS